jgi:hypothetical protein
LGDLLGPGTEAGFSNLQGAGQAAGQLVKVDVSFFG